MRLLVLAVLCALPCQAVGQEHPDLARAAQAWEATDFEAVIAAARDALRDTLSLEQRVEAWERIAIAYQGLDMRDSVLAALTEYVQLAPDREFDREVYGPDFFALHAWALSRALIVRRPSADSSTFRAGQAGVQVRYEVTLPATVHVQLVGPAGFAREFDRGLVSSADIVEWNGLAEDGTPAPAGQYTFQINARDGDQLVNRTVRIELRRVEPMLDPHIDAIPGLEELPEFESPPRNWQLLAVAGLSVAVGTGAALMIESGAPGVSRRELIAIDVAALLTGLWWSLKKPPPQRVEANIMYNAKVRELVAEENLRIDEDNARRQQEVLLTVVPVTREGS